MPSSLCDARPNVGSIGSVVAAFPVPLPNNRVNT